LDVDQISWSPDSPDLLASVSVDKTVKLWDTRIKSCAFTVNTDTENINIDMSCTHIAAASKDDVVNFINLKTQTVESTLKSDVEVNEMLWSHDGQLIFVSTGAGIMSIIYKRNYSDIHISRS
jgi:THO complex subunit 3